MASLCLNSSSLVNKTSFKGKSLTSKAAKAPVAARSNKLVVRSDAGYIGSAANWVMVANIAGCLAAGRFKKSPISFMVPNTKEAEYAAMADAEGNEGMGTDPAGYTAAQVLAFGSLGHVHGIGMVLGMRAAGLL